ncbi:MAG: 2-isopropylmalate synthase [Clostridia bacterium]|nr:2-isopropylmalate synthase [Clostridia bacterium]MBO7503852.1 2-isopropylmalate synthase [Clostridia bacterium]MBO7659503.1 2-isopropylmalate synthase [Clostridia bacterium]MBP5665384.1 2-isopropylmalate synthase [Clostridia bacterium]MBP5767308.1 2-isopropylmalate synthase [Clostridia bacterium]
MRRIELFDSTLRDGEQAPGFSMNLTEKLSMARVLAELGVDVIEAGFAACSQGDFASVKAVADELKGVTVASLCRCTEKDAEIAWNALKNAEKPLLHIFIATSDLHLETKLGMTREQVVERVAATVSYAKTLCPDIEFSAEDATRSDRNFLAKVLQTALSNGASVVNMADTVGIAQPDEIEDLVRFMKSELKSANTWKLSVHCHNDLGLATANTLAAIKAGADRVDVTVNGIGERAGNAAVEEVVMALKMRPEIYDADTGANPKMLVPASRKLVMLTGCKVQANKAVVGKNAFAHEAGIHQHGMMKDRRTYEIFHPEDVGATSERIILGKHSGRHALEDRISELGIGGLDKEQLDTVFEKFKLLAETKKTVGDRDIEAIVRSEVLGVPEIYRLDKYVINSGNILSNTCNIRICRKGETYLDGFAAGEGPIDAAYNAINDALKKDAKLLDYVIESVTGGADAQGAVSVKLSVGDKTVKGYGVSVNIFEASILAYLNALNALEE